MNLMMSKAHKLTDHEAAKRIHEILKRELHHHKDKSKLIQHLKAEHPDVYAGLISECETHGAHIKGKIEDFARDITKTLPKERMDGVRKALKVVEERPDLLTQATSKVGWWVAGIASAVGVGVYLANQYGQRNATQPSSQMPQAKDSWAERTQPSDQIDERAL